MTPSEIAQRDMNVALTLSQPERKGQRITPQRLKQLRQHFTRHGITAFNDIRDIADRVQSEYEASRKAVGA